MPISSSDFNKASLITERRDQTTNQIQTFVKPVFLYLLFNDKEQISSHAELKGLNTDAFYESTAYAETAFIRTRLTQYTTGLRLTYDKGSLVIKARGEGMVRGQRITIWQNVIEGGEMLKFKHHFDTLLKSYLVDGLPEMFNYIKTSMPVNRRTNIVLDIANLIRFASGIIDFGYTSLYGANDEESDMLSVNELERNILLSGGLTEGTVGQSIQTAGFGVGVQISNAMRLYKYEFNTLIDRTDVKVHVTRVPNLCDRAMTMIPRLIDNNQSTLITEEFDA